MDAVALAAALARPWADVVLSGAATLAQLDSNIKSLDVTWDVQAESEIHQLTEAPDAYWQTRSETLAPRHIPPREVRLALTGGVVRTAAPTVRPPRPLACNDQPYVEHIVSVFRALAQNRVLPGYELRKVGRGERLNCRQPRLSVTTAQVLEGGGLRILAAKARNRGKQPIVLEEHRCSAGSGTLVAAVAAWPRSRLAPGEETELYVAVRPPESDSERGGRPSLLGRQR
jgi:conjugal transfer pilus assembly protein TraK